MIGAGGPGMEHHVFRVLDPAGGPMMAVRADMTPQVARIATTRLSRAPRPLRLSYGGQVLTVRGSQLRPERQFTQAGAELIGTDSVEADIEILVLAVEALAGIGIENPTVDLNSPALVDAVLEALEDGNENVIDLRAALDRKDQAAVSDLAGGGADILAKLVEATGAADETLAKLNAIALPDVAVREVERLAAVAAGTRAHLPDLALTVDPVEYRGFEYQTGISFTLFCEGVRGELGRGGRYVTEAGEPATGLTIFLDTICRAVAAPAKDAKRAYLPAGTAPAAGAALRAAGWITVAGLGEDGDARGEAKRLGCTHLLEPGTKDPAELS